jgi:roadblock/LC7 domain-containing protein
MEIVKLDALRDAFSARLTRRTLLGHAAAGGALSATGVLDVSAAPRTVDTPAELPGVSLFVEWNADGSLKRYVSNQGHSRAVAEQAATYGAIVSTMAPGLATAYSQSTEMRWAPFRAMVVYGGDCAAVIGAGNQGVWVDAANANIDDIVEVLGKPQGRLTFKRVPRATKTVLKE